MHVSFFCILIADTSCCTLLTIVQRHDKFTAPIREYRLWQIAVFHGKPNRRNPGIAILSFPQGLHYGNKNRVSGIRLGIAQLVESQSTIKPTRICDLDPIGIYDQLDRHSLGMQTIIPVYQRVEYRLADSVHRILRNINSLACFFVDPCGRPHIGPNKGQRTLQHIRKRTFDPLCVAEPVALCVKNAHLLRRYTGGNDAQLRIKRLRVESEQQQCRHGDFPIPRDAGQFILLCLRHTRQIRTRICFSLQIRFHLRHIQRLEGHPFRWTNIVLIFLSERLVAVHFVLRHGLVSVTYADVGSV